MQSCFVSQDRSALKFSCCSREVDSRAYQASHDIERFLVPPWSLSIGNPSVPILPNHLLTVGAAEDVAAFPLKKADGLAFMVHENVAALADHGTELDRSFSEDFDHGGEKPVPIGKIA